MNASLRCFIGEYALMVKGGEESELEAMAKCPHIMHCATFRSKNESMENTLGSLQGKKKIYS